jgi:hypothetical protein
MRPGIYLDKASNLDQLSLPSVNDPKGANQEGKPGLSAVMQCLTSCIAQWTSRTPSAVFRSWMLRFLVAGGRNLDISKVYRGCRRWTPFENQRLTG